ncbi:MAG: hypothetical protein Q8P18_22365 [Pseudomonadota bacterium]|nr:hypothetical protein [Pseudomonadota bacterium]
MRYRTALLALSACGGQSGENGGDLDCRIVPADAASVPTDWDVADIEAIVASTPSGVIWSYGAPDPDGATETTLSIAVTTGAAEWIQREGADLSSSLFCREGVQLAVAATWSIVVAGGEAVGSGEGTLYAAGPDASLVYLGDADYTELPATLSASWQAEAERRKSEEYGWDLFVQEAWMVPVGTWAEPELDIEAKFGTAADPGDGPRSVLWRGSWSAG